MHPLEAMVTVLTGLFALGALGCVVAIPVCAYKFFRVLFETDAEDETASSGTTQAIEVVETAAEPAIKPATATTASSESLHQRPTLAVIPIAVSPHPHRHRLVPKRNRRPRRTAGKSPRI